MSRSICIKLGAGSEPECIEIDDAKEAVGEVEDDGFGNVVDLCIKSPSGQHQYSVADQFRACVYCGEDSEL